MEPGEKIQVYNSAVQLYSQEIKTINDRNSSFLLTQSILLVAFIQITIGRNIFPIAYEILAVTVGLVATIFCFLYYKAGSSGSVSALKYKKFLIEAETNSDIKLLTNIYIPKKHTHSNFDGKCEICYFERSPLPHSWLWTTYIFLLLWSTVLVYIFTSLLIRFNPANISDSLWIIKVFNLKNWDYLINNLTYFYRFGADWSVNLSGIINILIIVLFIFSVIYFLYVLFGEGFRRRSKWREMTVNNVNEF
jgi:hypothetical protein